MAEKLKLYVTGITSDFCGKIFHSAYIFSIILFICDYFSPIRCIQTLSQPVFSNLFCVLKSDKLFPLSLVLSLNSVFCNLRHLDL